jgi:type IV secretion system protein TrbI
VENQKNPNPPPVVRDMEAPTGIDLNPDPPATRNVSKRAFLVGVGIICGVAALLSYGVYQRGDEYKNGALMASEKNIAPATAAASAITKDIPSGMVNLSTDRDKNPTDWRSNSDEKANPESTNAAMPTPFYSPSVRTYEPRPEERRIAEAYEREIRALVAPTAIQAAKTADSFQEIRDFKPASSSAPDSLTALAQILTPRIASSTPAQILPSTVSDDQNLQTRKEAFLTKARVINVDNYLKSTRTASISRYEIKAGWEIPAIMEQAVNSDLPGDLKALVTANVYDTATGNYLLIPQGARLIGSYDSAVAYGQNGLQVIWNRIIFPDASSVDLSGMVGQDAHGASGFRQDVDNHYKRLIGFSVLSSLFSAGFQLSQPRRGTILQYPTAAEIAAGSVGQEVSQTGAQITRKNLNIQPTIKVPIGYKFNVRVNRDMLFDSPYDPGQAPRLTKLPLSAGREN